MVFSIGSASCYNASSMAVKKRIPRPVGGGDARRRRAATGGGRAVRGVARALASPEARLAGLRERREREHRALLSAARRVFVRRGYAGTRVEDVLRAAGISTRAFYRFHASKDELFLELFGRAHAAAMVRLRAVVGERRSALERLDAHLDATLDLAYDPRLRGETRLFASVPGELAERHATEVRRCREELVGLLRAVLEEGLSRGELRGVSPDIDAWAIHGVLAAALTRVLEDDEWPPRARLEQRLRELMRAALGADPPPRRGS